MEAVASAHAPTLEDAGADGPVKNLLNKSLNRLPVTTASHKNPNSNDWGAVREIAHLCASRYGAQLSLRKLEGPVSQSVKPNRFWSHKIGFFWNNLGGLVFSLLFLTASASFSDAKAQVITSFTAGTGTTSFVNGQSITTPTGGPWTNFSFNFYANSTGNPFATGNLYLLSQAYAGAPNALSSSTAGYMASAAANGGGTAWVFNSVTTLNASTQYFFYMDSLPGQALSASGSNLYSGGNRYSTGSASASYLSYSGQDMNFTLTDLNAAPGPEVGAGLLSWLLAGAGALGFLGWRRRHGASAWASQA